MSILYDELTTGSLAQELASLIASGDDGAILSVLNRKDIPVKGVIKAHDIKAMLFAYGFWNAIKHNNSVACEDTVDALSIFDSFDLSNPVYLGRLVEILDGLVAEPLIPDFTEVHKQAILAMGDAFISRAEQLGLNLRAEDVRAVIWNDDGSRKI